MAHLIFIVVTNRPAFSFQTFIPATAKFY